MLNPTAELPHQSADVRVVVDAAGSACWEIRGPGWVLRDRSGARLMRLLAMLQPGGPRN